MTDKLKFLKELSKLLKNYDASISWGCDPASDLHGVIDDHISIDVRNVKLRFNDCYIDEYEIDKHIEEIEEVDVNQCMQDNNDFYTVIYDSGENYLTSEIVNGKKELKEFIQSLFNNLDEQERESCLRKFNIFKGLNLSYCYVPTKMAIIDGKETIYVELKG